MTEQTANTRGTPINLSIPPCPALLLEIQDAMREPEIDPGKIAATVKRDVAMTAELLKLANSPLSGIRHKIASVDQAISFLGLKATTNLINNVALRQSMNGNSDKFAKFWERSSLTAAVASRIAMKVAYASPDEAYLATLFHECGIPILMQRFPDYRETVMAETRLGQGIQEIEDAHFSTTHPIVGNLLARNWRLPQPVCEAILYHHDATILDPTTSRINIGVRKLVAIINLAERIVDEYFLQPNAEWDVLETGVRSCLGLSHQELNELKDDMLEFLNEE